MEDIRREITLYTPGKRYHGEIDMPNPDLRTTDLLNRENLYWKDPVEKTFNDVLLLFNAILSIDGIEEFQKFEKVQIRQPDIIFFHDHIDDVGNAVEKKRTDIRLKNKEIEKKFVHLLTKVRFNSFFDIKGSFYGLFKAKSEHKYIPLSDVVMYEIIRKQDKWVKKKIPLANNFIGVNTYHIETCAFE